MLLPGADISQSEEYLDDVHRNRRNLINNNFKNELHNHDYDSWEYYDPEVLNYDKHADAKSKRDNAEGTINTVLRGYVDPYYDLYAVDPKKVTHEDSVKMVASKLSKIRALEERLRHIEEMQMSLDRKIQKLQLLKEQETSTKLRIESEVSAAEREWKDAVERLKPGTYEPLDSLGDTSHIF